ncbi:MAG: C39 family peptidase [Bdellovibrionota bacterium]
MIDFPFSIPNQPDDETCGVACLLGVYQYFGMKEDFESLLQEVEMLDSGGTLSVNLGIHALKNNFEVTLNSYNLQLFDPSWSRLAVGDLVTKLRQQMVEKSYDSKLIAASRAFIDYLELGGDIRFGDFSLEHLKSYVDKKIPVVVGLSSTFLYQSKREIPETTESDDIKGYPAGHFVVLNGYKDDGQQISVCDPYRGNPFSKGENPYLVDRDHLLTSIFLGILTYDANFLIIKPK